MPQPIYPMHVPESELHLRVPESCALSVIAALSARLLIETDSKLRAYLEKSVRYLEGEYNKTGFAEKFGRNE